MIFIDLLHFVVERAPILLYTAENLPSGVKMSIEAIETEANYLNLEGFFTESSKDSEEAIGTYQNPGPHSGMARLVEQELLLIGATSNLRMVAITEKCKEIEQIFSTMPDGIKNECYLLMVEKTATIDTSLAKSL